MQVQLKKTACAVTLALSLGAAQAGAINGIWFFGDSLTDGGAYTGIGPLPAGSRWTTDNAPNHADVLAAALGLKSSATNALTGYNPGGNNYAQGGAQSSEVANKGPGDVEIRDVPTQLKDYLARTGGKANPNALYFVWSGGNDIPTAAATPATAQASIAQSATSLAKQVATLKAAGANLVMAPNLPAFGNTPAALYGAIQAYALQTGTAANLNNAIGAAWQKLSLQPSNSPAQAKAVMDSALKAAAATLHGVPEAQVPTQALAGLNSAYSQTRDSLNTLTAFFNSSVDGALTQSGANVVRPDVAGLFAAVQTNPASFGVSNTTGSACIPSASSLTCSSGAQTPGQLQGLSYVFADDRHPTPLTHQVLGDYFASIVQAPALADALGQVPLSARRIVRETLSAHARALDAAPRAVGTVGALASAGFGRDNIAEGEIKPEAIATLGFDYQATPALALGVAFSGGKVKSDIGAIGSYDGDYRSLSALANFRQGPLWLDGDVFLGNTDIDTRRDVKLGPVYHETQTGSTRAIQMGLALEGGYRMQLGVVNTGPQAGLRYEHIKVGALIEDKLDFSAMRFGEQKIKSLVGSLGWGIEAPLGKATPYASISYSHEFKGDARDIEAGLLTTSGNFVTQSLALAKNWTDLSAGVSVALAKNITGFVQINGTAGRDDGNAWGGNLGLNMNF
ncbi:autotransporter outer membrane beta-barrel domain-containing protein [Craterilacuibacter sinensis]|uniref:Autotransporter domain-containing protein n=1 Tax=Craterilacuibacter sinensis TaxID=2686017 RepID=A0A845BPE1_9NEIS|nr:autotransporter domain-containing protein [Craterilacuibacter sinensis]MXR38322.1 autotransporter domain-containing protein [Craterilacuibacter sinensis]